MSMHAFARLYTSDLIGNYSRVFDWLGHLIKNDEKHLCLLVMLRPSHIYATHGPRIEIRKIRPVRRCASNFCQNLGEASELTTHAQRVASAVRIQCACRAHTVRTC